MRFRKLPCYTIINKLPNTGIYASKQKVAGTAFPRFSPIQLKAPRTMGNDFVLLFLNHVNQSSFRICKEVTRKIVNMTHPFSWLTINFKTKLLPNIHPLWTLEVKSILLSEAFKELQSVMTTNFPPHKNCRKCLTPLTKSKVSNPKEWRMLTRFCWWCSLTEIGHYMKYEIQHWPVDLKPPTVDQFTFPPFRK